MKAWSKSWISSKNRRKQRKYRLNAPKHIRNELLSATLSKKKKKKLGSRAVPLRTKDYVKVLRGDHKGISGEIIEVDRMKYKIYINGIVSKKRDSSEVKVAVDPSNVVVTALHMEDDKRFKKSKLSQKIKESLKKERKNKEPKKETKTETKEIKKESKKSEIEKTGNKEAKNVKAEKKVEKIEKSSELKSENKVKKEGLKGVKEEKEANKNAN